ncbi:MAG: hypothetical protein ACRDYX_18160 [Egibacteraceae bacterium]
MSVALLLVGYALALPGTWALLRVAWRRWVWAFVALEVGTGCIVARWGAARAASRGVAERRLRGRIRGHVGRCRPLRQRRGIA